jgi:hypothetical protein
MTRDRTQHEQRGREEFLYDFKGGSLRSPPAPAAGPQAAVLAGPRRRDSAGQTRQTSCQSLSAEPSLPASRGRSSGVAGLPRLLRRPSRRLPSISVRAALGSATRKERALTDSNTCMSRTSSLSSTSAGRAAATATRASAGAAARMLAAPVTNSSPMLGSLSAEYACGKSRCNQ